MTDTLRVVHFLNAFLAVSVLKKPHKRHCCFATDQWGQGDSWSRCWLVTDRSWPRASVGMATSVTMKKRLWPRSGHICKHSNQRYLLLARRFARDAMAWPAVACASKPSASAFLP